MAQVLLLMYVLISVPLRLAFSIDAECGTPGFFIDLCVDVYFICDIFFNFRTGCAAQDSSLGPPPPMCVCVAAANRFLK